MTGAETAVWALLRARRLDGLKFRRQAPVAGGIADFACHELKLIIELDGGIHDLREVEDTERDARMAASGYTVLRFRNEAVLRNPNILIEAIRAHAEARGVPPHPGRCATHLLPHREKDH